MIKFNPERKTEPVKPIETNELDLIETEDVVEIMDSPIVLTDEKNIKISKMDDILNNAKNKLKKK